MKVNRLFMRLSVCRYVCLVMRRFVVSARHVAQVVTIHGARTVECDHVVHLGANANPLAHFVVVMAGHMSHHRLACFQTQGVQKL